MYAGSLFSCSLNQLKSNLKRKKCLNAKIIQNGFCRFQDLFVDSPSINRLRFFLTVYGKLESGASSEF